MTVGYTQTHIMRSKYKIIPAHVIKEETKELDEKPLHSPPSGKMIH